MDAWSGTAGRLAGDVNISNLFGEDQTRCRKALLSCRGVKICEFFDSELLEGIKRYAPDESIFRITNYRLDQNADDEDSMDAMLARQVSMLLSPFSLTSTNGFVRFYTRMMQPCRLDSCTGRAILVPYKKDK
jgi:hypothetical protein